MLTTITLCVLGLALIGVGVYLWYRRHIEDEASFGHDDVRWEQIDIDDGSLVEKTVSELDQLTAMSTPQEGIEVNPRDAIPSQPQEFDRGTHFIPQGHADTPEFGADMSSDSVAEGLDQIDEKIGKLMGERGESHDLNVEPGANLVDDINHSSAVSELQALQDQAVIESTLDEDPEMVVSVHVVAKSGREFHGDQLLEAFNQLGLQHGDRDIFHFYDSEKDSGPIRFSAANMIEPGTFDLDTMDSIKTNGVTLFMLLPGHNNPDKNNTVQTFERLLDTARMLARYLGGELRDSQRSTLTAQGINLIKESIHRFYSRRQMYTEGKSHPKGTQQQGQLNL